MKKRTLAITIGIQYLIIFVCGIFGNFFVLEALKEDPATVLATQGMIVRLGILAFLLASVADIIVAWALQVLYKENVLSLLSTIFRVSHAVIMGIAVFSLVQLFSVTSSAEMTSLAEQFNIIWLIGLFFFGFHLMLLARILKKPRFIAIFLFVAGAMYSFDTVAHFVLPNYHQVANIFLTLVAVPSILGEMAFGFWMLIKAHKRA